MESFQGTNITYQPLEGNEIRLVKLKPSTDGGNDQKIEVELFHAPLDDSTKFYALSYVWGDATETRNVLLDGKDFPVTLSLWNALYHIRARPGSRPLGYEEGVSDTWLDVTASLWIDAICINQKSLAERSEQVPRMSDIYSNASRVIVWPPTPMPGERLYEGFVFWVSIIATLARIIWPSRGLTGYLNNAPDGPDEVLINHLSSVALETVQFLGIVKELLVASVLAHSRRLWTTQEVVLASTEPLFLLGFHDANAFHLDALRVRLRNLCLQPDYYEKLNDKSIELGLGYDPLLHALMTRFIFKVEMEMYDSPNDAAHGTDRSLQRFAARLFRMLQRFCGMRESHDPRDRIYSMLGMAKLPVPPPPDLRPDYECPFAEVAFSYAKFLVRHIGHLGLLGFGVGSLEGCPSWVPAFNIPQPAPPQTESITKLSVDGRCLTARGSELAHVLAVFLPTSDPAVPADPWAQLRDDGLHAVFAHWSEFLNSLIRSSANLRRESPQAVLRKWLEILSGATRMFPPRTVDQIASAVDFFDCQPGPSTPSKPAQAAGMAIRNILQDYVHVLAEDGSLFAFQKRCETKVTTITTLPREGDLACVLRGTVSCSMLRRIEESSSPDDFRILGANYMQLYPDFPEVNEAFFSGRAERDFNLW
ncbi:hypothetical protein MAPG_03574 [Magnaporthiopsis poae ATCC 64411]|uniref:Heterokaryon incompatibility domain-containing protein n=1 Tax=Magnaporthiopsis poae (strain ATCC 64411 / 73-15) TaxID=644358 RepID=A0A0C4DUD4_MAGP6|nr:hypothetical protein MAPG_03574 [Magnaporthiopsis poae ATCC 64411]